MVIGHCPSTKSTVTIIVIDKSGDRSFIRQSSTNIYKQFGSRDNT